MASSEEVITFPEQTGDAWSRNEQEPYRFKDEQQLKTYIEKVATIFVSTRERYQFNTVPSFVSFFEEFSRAGVGTVKDMFERGFPVNFSVDRLSSVGLNYILYERVKKGLEGTLFSGSIGNLYLASGCYAPGDQMIAAFQDRNPICSETLMEYVIVAMKIIIGDRKGHVLMDQSYGLGTPIVIMEDEQAPHSEPFISLSCIGHRIHRVKQLTEDFAVWSVTYDQDTNFRLFFLRHHFQRIDYAEKRQKANPFQGRMRCAEGKPTMGFFTYLDPVCSTFTFFKVLNGRNSIYKVACDQVFPGGAEVSDNVVMEHIEALGSSAENDLRRMSQICLNSRFTSTFSLAEAFLVGQINNLFKERLRSSGSLQKIGSASSLEL